MKVGAIGDRIGDVVERVRPAPRVPKARQRGVNSPALQGGGSIARSKLQAQRDELAREFVELQWDLGGIVYEMASRDHFRLDVLTKRAAKLQQVDSALGQAERMLKLGEEGVAGTCPSCGGVQARGAIYCWQCGNEMTPANAAAPSMPTAQMPVVRPQEAPVAHTLAVEDPAAQAAVEPEAPTTEEPAPQPLSVALPPVHPETSEVRAEDVSR